MTVGAPAFSSHTYVGSSVAFEGPHVVLKTVLPLPRSRWPSLLAESIEVARSLAGAVAGGDILARAADAIQAASPATDPWSPWLSAFGQVHEVPGWSQRIECSDDGGISLRIGCRYSRAINRWAELGLRLLRLGARSLEAGTVEAKAGAWEKALALLGTDLPDRHLMRLHAALTRERVPWEWLAADRTSVGQGSRKTLLRGAPPDVELEALRLAAMDLHVPIYTVTGSWGKTTTLRLLTQLLDSSGLRLGIQASDGAWAAATQLFEGDCIEGRVARAIMRQGDVDAAVLEFGRGGLIDFGFPFARTDVAVLLNLGEFHLGADDIETIEEMAEVKALTLTPARIAVLNRDDAQCRRVAGRLDPGACVWFSTTAAAEALRQVSHASRGALGVSRDQDGSPLALEVWVGGVRDKCLPLDGVAPYHGMLGEKTLEELLAAVAAVSFGPVAIDNLEELLPRLRLDEVNHRFRTSSHAKGNLLFVLDKAAEAPSLTLLRQTLGTICERHQVARSIVVMTRSPAERPEHNLNSCEILHPLFDEFILFDRTESYSGVKALPVYEPGSIPLMLGAEFQRLNRLAGEEKPVRTAESWEEAEAYLRARLAAVDVMTLVLISQPTSGAVRLNGRITWFVEELTGAAG